MPGAAGTAETGVVRVGAKSGVNYQLTVCKLRLVQAFWREVSACNGTVDRVKKNKIKFKIKKPTTLKFKA